MTEPNDELSDERLDAMLKGLDGATQFDDGDLMRYDHGGGRLAILPARGGGQRNLVADFYHEADREHFTRCSPDTIRSLVTELQRRRASDAVVSPELNAHLHGDDANG